MKIPKLYLKCAFNLIAGGSSKWAECDCCRSRPESPRQGLQRHQGFAAESGQETVQGLSSTLLKCQYTSLIASIDQDDAKAAEGFVTDTLSRISVSVDAERAAAASDLVVEAIVEKLNIKQKLFTTLDAVIKWFI